MEKGFSFESFGKITRACKKTMYNWCDEFPEFLHAKNIGEVCALHFYEDIGIKMSKGEYDKGKTGVWAMIMKNRFKYRNDPEQGDSDTQPKRFGFLYSRSK